MMKTLVSLIASLNLFMVAPAFATTYYVSSHGSDANTGTDPSTPWATLHKVNGRTLLPGDGVRLDCSSTFREMLSLDQSGTAHNVITYSSYGTCADRRLPLLSGADAVGDWSSEKVSTFLCYSSTLPVAPAILFEDSQRLTPVRSQAAMVRGTFFYDTEAKKLHIRTREDDFPVSHLIEVPIRPYVIQGYRTSYVSVTGIEADKALLDDVSITGSLTNLTFWAVNTQYAVRNGMWFSANTGESQNNVLIRNSVASNNGANGMLKGNGGTNFVFMYDTANHNAFDPQYQFTAGIRLVSDGTTSANRPTFSGVLVSTANFNGRNPDTGAAADSSLQDGMGVWCDTCGDGSFLSGNMTRGNVQAGADIEFAGTVGTQSMTYNTGVGNFYGVLLTRRSHNVTVANNTEVSNFINCDIQGEYGGGEKAIGMIGNVIRNNVCSEKVMNAYGTSLVVRWGAENNDVGEGSDNVYSNNALGSHGAGNGELAMWGNNQMVSTYSALDALYGSHAHGASASWYSAPINFVNAPALNFTLIVTTTLNSIATTAATTDRIAGLPNLGAFAPQ